MKLHSIKLDVRLQDETVWLTQPLMTELLQTTQQKVSQHIQNIYQEGELHQDGNSQEILVSSPGGCPTGSAESGFSICAHLRNPRIKGVRHE